MSYQDARNINDIILKSILSRVLWSSSVALVLFVKIKKRVRSMQLPRKVFFP